MSNASLINNQIEEKVNELGQEVIDLLYGIHKKYYLKSFDSGRIYVGEGSFFIGENSIAIYIGNSTSPSIHAYTLRPTYSHYNPSYTHGQIDQFEAHFKLVKQVCEEIKQMYLKDTYLEQIEKCLNSVKEFKETCL